VKGASKARHGVVWFKRIWVHSAVLGLVAFVVRALYIHQTSADPAFALPLVDAEVYDRAARAWAEDGSYEQDAFFFHSFLYPYFLALIYKWVAPSVELVRWLQALIGAVTAVLTQRLGTKIAGPRVGLCAGLVVALYGPLIFIEGVLVAEGVATFLTTALVLLGCHVHARNTRLGWLSWGVLAGLCVLLRGTFVPVVLVLTAALAYETRKNWLSLSAGAFGFCVVVIPVALLSQREVSRFTFVPASGGVNLHLGNNLERCRTLALRPGFDWEMLIKEPQTQGYQDLWQRDTYFKDKALRYASDNPVHLVAGFADKASQWFSAREIPRNLDVYLFSERSAILRALVWRIGPFGFPFGLLGPLALLGLIMQRSKLPRTLWLCVMVYSLAHVIVFGASRYRVVLVPLLAICAAIGATELWRMTRSRLWLTRAAIVVCAVLISLRPGPFCQERPNFRAELEFLIGATYERQHAYDEAVDYYRRALTSNPEYFEAHHFLGKTLSVQRQTKQAIAHLQTAHAIHPDYVPLLVDLSRALGEDGQLAEATHLLERAVALEPQDASAHNNLGTALALQRKFSAAHQHFRSAVALEPSSEDYQANLRRAQQAMMQQNVQQSTLR